MDISMAPLQSLPFGFTISEALTLLLSVVLAGLYVLMWMTQRRQADIQDRQADIQERQAEIQETQNNIITQQTGILAADYNPDIRISQAGGGNIKVNTIEGRDAIHICLSNHGHGRAKNLWMGCVIYLKQEQDEKEPTYTPAWMVTDRDCSISLHQNPLIRVDSQSEEGRN